MPITEKDGNRGNDMKNVHGYLLVSAILLGIVFGWKGLLVIGLLSPTAWFACYLESDPSPKADYDTDTASLAAASLGEENDHPGDDLGGSVGEDGCDADTE